MTAKKTIPAKIARPRLSFAIERERLFGLLDGKMARPVVWVSSPAGSGKTTLISGYLESRKLPCLWYRCDDGDSDLATFFYYMGLAARGAAPSAGSPLPLLTPGYGAAVPAFAWQYFEKLFHRLSRRPAAAFGGPGFCVVLDNYQEIPEASPLHGVIAIGLEAIPEDMRVIVASRTGPPPALARLMANDRMGVVDYSDLRFTLEESKELVRRRVPGSSDEQISGMHKETGGWAAGIVLMLEKSHLDRAGSACGPEEAFEGVFDYFAGEIFDRTEPGVRDFLLRTAFLPVLEVSLVEKLTGARKGKEILSDLNRHHYFTERLSGDGLAYRYHPLFRAFLLDRARVAVPSDDLAAIERRAASLLEQSGEFEEAARLYADVGDGDGLARLVTRHGHVLLSQGRNKVVEEWLGGIPKEAVEADPWLSYWSGMCTFPVDLAATRKHLRRAFESFTAAGEVAGVCLSWAGMIDAYAYTLDEWDRLDEWIDRFNELPGHLRTPPSGDVDLIVSSRMLVALTLRRTDRTASVAAWYERVSFLLRRSPSVAIQMDTMFCMSLYYLWKGEYRKNGILLEKAEATARLRSPAPFAVIRVKLMKGIHCWVTAEYDAALRTLAEGLDIAAKSGIHVFDSLLWSFHGAAEMASGRTGTVEKILAEQMASSLEGPTTLATFFYYLNSGWYAALKGDYSRAGENMEAVSSAAERMGTPYYKALWSIGMAQVAYARGHVAEARLFVRRALDAGLAMGSRVIEWYALFVEAYFLLEKEKDEEGLRTLRQALSLGRKHGYVHLEFYQPKVARFLYARALEEGIEPEYVKEQIGKLGLTPPLSGAPNTSRFLFGDWPYPVKIYTLGRFAIVKDGSPLEFTGKLQKKPLEMLKALVAAGCVNVPEEGLVDVLWPEAEGDLAHKSFETTLSRLRRLLGGESLVRYRAGHLSIDPSLCWVDCLALEQAVENAGRSASGQAVPLFERAVGLYEGPFLPSDTNAPWTARRREVLKNVMLRAVAALGAHLEAAGQWERAADYYAKGLDADDLAEELYQRLMVCYQRLGNRAGAARTYDRCRRLLREHLFIEPSSETKAIYFAALKNP